MQRKERRECIRVEFSINFEEFKDHSTPHLKLSINLKLRPSLGIPKEELPILEVGNGDSRQRGFDRLLLEIMTFLFGSCVLQAFLSNTSANIALFYLNASISCHLYCCLPKVVLVSYFLSYFLSVPRHASMCICFSLLDSSSGYQDHFLPSFLDDFAQAISSEGSLLLTLCIVACLLPHHCPIH